MALQLKMCTDWTCQQKKKILQAMQYLLFLRLLFDQYDFTITAALQSLVMVSMLAAMAVGIGLLLTLGNAYLRIFLSADKITADTVRYGNTFLYVDYAM